MVKSKRWGKKHEDKRVWKEYNERLIKRGQYYIDPRFLETWLSETKNLNRHKVGQPFMYPTSLIKFLAVLKAKNFDLRSLQGVIRALSKRFGNFPVISFSQIRRRIKSLPLNFEPKGDHLITGTDGSGLKVSNRGEWVRQKWKVRRGWVKVVILGDTKGNVVDIRVGNEELDENKSSRGMLRKNSKHIDKNLADGLHDRESNFNLYDKLNIEPGIKIRKGANPTGMAPRPYAVQEYQNKGYKKWAKDLGYGFRWLATEGIYSSVKTMFGEQLKSHNKKDLYHEARLKFWAYQQIKEIA